MKWSQLNLFGFPRLEDLEPESILANRLVPGSVILLYWEHNSEPFSRAILVVKSCTRILLISAVVMSSLSQWRKHDETRNKYVLINNSTASWEGARVHYESQKELRPSKLFVTRQPSG